MKQKNVEEVLQSTAASDLVDLGAVPHHVHKRELALLLVLAGIQFTHIMDYMVMMPLGPQFMRLFDISPQQFALLVSIYTFSAGICGFIAAFVIDKFDRKTALMFLYGGFALATLLCALAPGYEWLLAARAVAGAFGGVMGAVVYAIIGDAIPESRRGAATGTVMSAFSLAAVAGVPTGLFLATLSDWRAPFYFLTVVSGLILIAVWYIVPAQRRHLEHKHERNPLKQLHAIFSNRTHLTAFLMFATLMFAGFSVIPFISPYMVANVGMKESELPYLYFFGGLATFFSSRLIGKLADKQGKRKTFALIAVASIIPIMLLTHFPKTSVVWAVAVTALFMVLVSGRLVPAMALITSSVEPRLRGSFMSFNSAIQQIATGFAALMAGAIIGESASGELLNYGTVGIVASLATLGAIYFSSRLGQH